MTFQEQINAEKMPKHVAIIMDGNGRWATARNLPRAQGHIQGAKTVRLIAQAAREINLRYLTLYVFSMENWNRPLEEINALMGLLVQSLKEETPLLVKEGIRLRVMGDISILDASIRLELEDTLRKTQENEKMDLVLALSYGSRWEITQAVKQISFKVLNGSLDLEDINQEVVESHLCSSFMPDPDLLIRTSGEYRISNFLLWQLAYSELYFTPVFWPDFSKEMFFEALVNYQQRERRFGKTANQIISEK
ncbi:MAG: isoprenyl transferase [Bacteroidales bacterium]